MKVKMLKKHAWALSPKETLRFNVGDVVDVPEVIGNEMIKIKWGEAVAEAKTEEKMQSGPDENKMLAPAAENKVSADEAKADTAQPGEIRVGDDIKVGDGEHAGTEGKVTEVDANPDASLADKVKDMTKDELVIFAKRNKIKIPFTIRNRDGILKHILKIIK